MVEGSRKFQWEVPREEDTLGDRDVEDNIKIDLKEVGCKTYS